jgi:hypothetical protein
MKRGTFLFDANVSKCHKQVLKFFQSRYGNWQVTQNFPIKIENHILFADLYFTYPHKIIIEVNGEQHYNYVSFFHKSMVDFEHGQLLDHLKREWCKINGFAYIEVDGREKFDADKFNVMMMESIMKNLQDEQDDAD